MRQKLIIFGAGGHAKSVAGVALDAGYDVLGFVDPHKQGEKIAEYPVWETLTEQLAQNAIFAIGVGDNALRAKIASVETAQYGLERFESIIHPSAVIMPHTKIGHGTVIMPNAVLGAFSILGDFTIVNTRASLDHDGMLHDYASLAPGVTCGGHVEIGVGSAIGLGASIRHNLKIGAQSVIGAQSYVHEDIPANVVAYGTPARVIKARENGDQYL